MNEQTKQSVERTLEKMVQVHGADIIQVIIDWCQQPAEQVDDDPQTD